MATQTPSPADKNTDKSADAKRADQLSDHCYDGIQEYDNPTPRWWDLIFFATVLFAPFYVLWFHAPNMSRTIAGQYKTAFAENMRLQFGEIGDLNVDEATLVKYMNDPKWLAVGQATFETNCISCHGTQGEGLSAPNLTDEYFLHIKKIEDIATVIRDGAKAGAMPAWNSRLHPNEVVLAACYVASMRGNNVTSSGRPQEGKKISPWPAAP